MGWILTAGVPSALEAATAGEEKGETGLRVSSEVTLAQSWVDQKSASKNVWKGMYQRTGSELPREGHFGQPKEDQGDQCDWEGTCKGGTVEESRRGP